MTPKIEQLFATGRISGSQTIKGVKFNFTLLDSRRLQDALNASVEISTDAQALAAEKQVLARAITNVDGEVCIEDPATPTKVEIDCTLELLNKLHYSIIQQLFESYDKLDKSVTKEVESDVKKSRTKAGVE